MSDGLLIRQGDTAGTGGGGVGRLTDTAGGQLGQAGKVSDGLLIRQGDTAGTGGGGVRRLTDTAGGTQLGQVGEVSDGLLIRQGGHSWDRWGRCQTAY